MGFYLIEMADKSSMKKTYCNKHNDISFQQVKKVSSISYIKNLVYWNHFTFKLIMCIG